VPYGDKFCTVTRYCITATASDRCHLRISSEVRYPRGEPWAITRKFIEQNAYDSLKGYFEQLFGNMTSHVAKNWLGLVPPLPVNSNQHASSATPKSHSRKSSQGAKPQPPTAAADPYAPAAAVSSNLTADPLVLKDHETPSTASNPVPDRVVHGGNQVSLMWGKIAHQSLMICLFLLLLLLHSEAGMVFDAGAGVCVWVFAGSLAAVGG
jgi:hypothetical protein